MADANGKHPDLYVRAQALISRAYQLPDGERDGFLRHECEGDSALHSEVAWLLEVLQSPDDDFLDPAPPAPALETSSELKVPAPRNYTLVRRLGEGGMGIVYLAERSEGEFRHRVALKLLNLLALQNPTVLARFLAERQILARLNHPNISHLVDAGALGDGRPFLAMEYIDGLRIDHYCDAQRLSVPARLQLFLKVCAAVHYAHQQLIIHRDIKPANVLVTADGEPKLLDFGIARLLESPTSTMADTVGAPRMMTLAYASPEQIQGKPLSTATDQYSLAVMLYELLVGTHPWGDTGDSSDIVEAVSRGEPLPPSVALRRRETALWNAPLRALWHRRKPELSKDLDAIVLKALSKRTEDRYGSVADLADDITAYLNGHPVKARQAHAWYWTRKFIGRHRIGVAVAALVLIMFVAFAFDREIQLERTQRERARAQAVADLMTSMFLNTDPTQAAQPNTSAREVLDRAVESIRSNSNLQADTRATLLQSVGEAYAGLGIPDPAKKAFDEALALLRQEPAVEPERMVEALTGIGDFYIQQLGDAVHGGALQHEAVTLALKTLPPGNRIRTLAMDGLASDLVSTKQGEGAESERLGQKALQEALDAHGAGSDDAILAQQQLAGIYINTGKLPEAERIYEELLPVVERRRGETHPSVLLIRNEYARTRLSERKNDGMEAFIKETLARGEKHYGADSPNVATYWNALADFYNRENRFAEAADAMIHAVDLEQKQNKDNPRLGQLVCNLAYALIVTKRLDEAEPRAQECVRLRFLSGAQLSGYYKGHALFVLGQLMEAKHDLPAARDAYERAIAEIGSDADRNGKGLYLGIDLRRVAVALAAKDVASARRYADDFEQNMTGMPDQAYMHARAGGLRAAIAAAEGNLREAARQMRMQWAELKNATSNCKEVVSGLRANAANYHIPAADLPQDLDQDPPCLR